MKKVLKWLQNLLIICLVAAVFFIAGTFFSNSRSSGAQMTSTALKNSLVSVSDLTTMEYHYTHIGKYSDSLKLYGWSVPLTKKSFILTYDGTIKAGYDLSKATIKVSGNRVNVTMPEPKIISHEIDENSIKEYDETHNIFNQISVSDFQKFAVSQKKDALKEAIDKGLYEKAQTKATSAIRSFVKAINKNAKVTVEYSD